MKLASENRGWSEDLSVSAFVGALNKDAVLAAATTELTEVLCEPKESTMSTMTRMRWVLTAGALACAGPIHPAWSDDVTHRAGAPREAISLAPEEHETVLGKMRDLLSLSQRILDGAVSADMKQVAIAGREGGLQGGAHMPPSVQAKLPLAFRQLAQGTHRTFDEIAQEAEQSGNRDVILRKLSENLQRCVTCHANYAIRDVQRSN